MRSQCVDTCNMLRMVTGPFVRIMQVFVRLIVQTEASQNACLQGNTFIVEVKELGTILQLLPGPITAGLVGGEMESEEK